MTVAYAIGACGGSLPLAASLVALSAFGRLYWLAHHLMDVSCGAMLSLAVCLLLDTLLRHAPQLDGVVESAATLAHAPPTCPPTFWWHAPLGLLTLIAQQKLEQCWRACAHHIERRD
jgi:membrane-associated phospholipid phosphatase